MAFFLVSGYRNQTSQANLFNSALIKKGTAHAVAYYAFPGRSEHQLGLGIDLGTSTAPYMTSRFTSTAAGQWIAVNGHLYGFILRYPAGKQSVTGYGYEAWHFRFVGIEAATAIKQKGITLDEYQR